MKILHSADWHLGRYFHGISLIEDQKHVLDQFVRLAVSEQVDAVVIAGDIYDRSVPPADAVALLDGVLAQLVAEAGIPVVVIAGNHDSAERIGFGGRILEKHHLIVRGGLDDIAPVVFEDVHGEVAIYPLPYVDPIFARALEGGESVSDHQSAVEHLLSLMQPSMKPGRRHILVGHAFVAGGSESESERPLSVGGSGMVTAATFDAFDFVALGHLHRPQSLGAEKIHYSGSLLKYSFNEADHTKSVSLVEIAADGSASIRRESLVPRRDVRIIKGTLAELLANQGPVASQEDYLCAHLTDTTPVLDPMARLREVYPNILELQFVRQVAGNAAARAAGDHRQRRPEDLFRAFYREMTGENISDAAIGVFSETAEPIVRASEEVGA
jgi:exonuclease SbcD